MILCHKVINSRSFEDGGVLEEPAAKYCFFHKSWVYLFYKPRLETSIQTMELVNAMLSRKIQPYINCKTLEIQCTFSSLQGIVNFFIKFLVLLTEAPVWRF
jgi:hypothetical protein